MSKELKTPPDDALNLNTYMKVVAYACLYKAYENHVDEIKLDEITITMVRERKPLKLLRWFEKNGYQIQEVFEGIYYVTKDNHFLTQIIVSKQLSKKNQKWLTLLSKDLDKSDAKRVVAQMESLTEENEKRYGDSVLQAALQENEDAFNKIKEERTMCEALRKLMEPEIKEEVDKAVSKAVKGAEENSKKNMISNALKNGSSAEDISRVMGIPLAEIEAIANGES